EPRSADALARISDGYRRLTDTFANLIASGPRVEPAARPSTPVRAPAVPASGGTGAPDAFGLAAPASVSALASTAMALGTEVPDQSPDQRLARLTVPLTELLARAGVPPLGVQLDADATRTRFDATAWTIGCALLTDDDFTVLEKLYHHARHAEQMFVALRWQAGRGILGRLSLFRQRSRVSREVLRAARDNPLRRQPVPGAAGARWWRDWFGPDAAAMVAA